MDIKDQWPIKRLLEQFRKLLRWTGRLSSPALFLGATAVVALTTLIQWLFWPTMAHHPYFLFLTAIAICSMVLERATGLYALFLSCVMLLTLFREYPLASEYHIHEYVTLFLFIVASLIVIAFGEIFRLLADSLNEADDTKAMLMREIHHRMKNYLQIISAETELEADKADHEETKALVERLSRRIATVAHIAQSLRQSDQKGLFDARDYFEKLTGEIAASLVGHRNLTINCRAEAVGIDRNSAELFGVIANELITNAVKYAFPQGRSGTVTVEFVRSPEGEPRLTVSDDGVGCAPETERGTGLDLVSALARLRGGGVDIQDAQPGCRVVVTMGAS